MAFGRIHRVRHQHGDGERSDSSRDRRVGFGKFSRRGGIDIAHEAAFAGMQTIHADVDYRGSGLNEIATDERWTANGRYENVGAAGLFGQVRGFRMTDGDGGVGMKQEQSHRFANDVAAPDNGRVFPGHGDLVTAEHFHDTGGGAGTWGGNVCDQVSDI